MCLCCRYEIARVGIPLELLLLVRCGGERLGVKDVLLAWVRGLCRWSVLIRVARLPGDGIYLISLQLAKPFRLTAPDHASSPLPLSVSIR